ncbi:hypothetical protein K469DRAFT_740550 [Zopfia rhizophila CBS 207.26]|uniref:Metallo-beta-lactamase domain-containing protein n=1 Tax=Zopfia rhizophila CBS 207.26 TaxID=1314779 RepID=A0A6A6DQZ4_9PEZI|nr:hypothetical protein K469DRAFT_740550 [Zopfia rhizophila CBS 207.26]
MNTVRLRAIDAKTERAYVNLNLMSVTFLAENERLGKKVLFGCGARKDFENFSPVVKARLNLNDHHDAPEKYPSSAENVVGPEFENNFMPGYPTDQKPFSSTPTLHQSYRDIREIFFDKLFKIGNFRAHDYFGDGSFYLLNTPSHAIGHMCGLDRTTPMTFVFLGDNICHFEGSFRPSPTIPLPGPIPASHLDSYFPIPCPCSISSVAHPAGPKSEESKTSPFFEVTLFAQSTYLDRVEAAKSIKKLQRFDENTNVFVCIDHDSTLLKKQEKAQWGWLNELPRDGKPGPLMLVTGVWKNGGLVRNFTELTASIY